MNQTKYFKGPAMDSEKKMHIKKNPVTALTYNARLSYFNTRPCLFRGAERTICRLHLGVGSKKKPGNLSTFCG